MTTYVGGVGINLTSASQVIILDPAKNPSNDEQSVDRAYRLRQTKDVIVYRLVTAGTIEEHTYRQQILKGEMSISVLQGEQCRREVKKQGRVLSIPPQGFGVAITHKELEAIYPNGFDQAVDSDINEIRSHGSVLGLTNHSLLFSKKEIVPIINEEYKKSNANDPFPTRLNDNHRSISSKEFEDMNFTMEIIRMPKKYVSSFVGEGGQNIKEMKRNSGGARIDLHSTDDLTSSQLYKITGTRAQMDSKENGEVLIPKNKIGLVIGKDGSNIKDTRRRSGADIELQNPTASGTRKFALRGTTDQIQRARALIYKTAKLNKEVGSSTLAPVLTGQDLHDSPFEPLFQLMARHHKSYLSYGTFGLSSLLNFFICSMLSVLN